MHTKNNYTNISSIIIVYIVILNFCALLISFATVIILEFLSFTITTNSILGALK